MDLFEISEFLLVYRERFKCFRSEALKSIWGFFVWNCQVLRPMATTFLLNILPKCRRCVFYLWVKSSNNTPVLWLCLNVTCPALKLPLPKEMWCHPASCSASNTAEVAKEEVGGSSFIHLESYLYLDPWLYLVLLFLFSPHWGVEWVHLGHVRPPCEERSLFIWYISHV